MFKGVTDPQTYMVFMSFIVERKVFLLGCIWSSFPADLAGVCVHVCMHVCVGVWLHVCVHVCVCVL